MPSIWVADLRVSQRTANKINNIHGLTVPEVVDAVLLRQGLDYVWDEHPERGLRAIIKTQIRGRPVLVVLYPTLDPLGDSWHLGSAYFV